MIVNVECVDFEKNIKKIYTDKEQSVLGGTLGEGSYFVYGSLEFGTDQCHVLIGKYTSIAHEVKFMIGLNHSIHSVSTYPFHEVFGELHGNSGNKQELERNQIIIGNDVWIGAYATILGGIKIGNGAVIGAGAVVAKDVPPYAVVVGNPARVIKYRFDEATIDWLQKLRWWNWKPEKIKVCWHEMKNMEAFKEKYWQLPKLAISAECQELKNLIGQFKAEDYQFYYFVPDLLSKEKVWQAVLGKFANVSGKQILFIDMSAGLPDNIKNKFTELVNSYQRGQLVLNQSSEEYDARHIVPIMDYIITTKEAESSQIVDYASDCSAKIVYGFDEFL